RIAKQADNAIDEKADTILVADGDSEFDSEPSDAPTHDSNSDGDKFSDTDSAMATLESGLEHTTPEVLARAQAQAKARRDGQAAAAAAAVALPIDRTNST
ncbi:hypothetical protein HDU99_006860, partial [Rhizoclosmatium hyalinum]